MRFKTFYTRFVRLKTLRLHKPLVTPLAHANLQLWDEEEKNKNLKAHQKKWKSIKFPFKAVPTNFLICYLNYSSNPSTIFKWFLLSMPEEEGKSICWYKINGNLMFMFIISHCKHNIYRWELNAMSCIKSRSKVSATESWYFKKIE